MLIKIEKIVAGGFGLGRLPGGMVVFVRHVLPGEEVRVRERRRRRGYIEAELEQVESPSPHRVEPRCPLYGRCGGCDLQHAASGMQQLIKEDIVREAMQRAGVEEPEGGIDSLIPSPRAFRYRRRLRLVVRRQGELGFRRHRSRETVAVAACFLAERELDAVLASTAEYGLHPCPATRYRELELVLNSVDRRVHLVPVARSGRISRRRGRRRRPVSLSGGVESFAWPSGGARAFSCDRSRENTVLYQKITLEALKKTVETAWGPACFSQVNERQNERLVNLVCSLAGDISGKNVIDLYCGMGNFSVPLALLGGRVTGIEENGESVRWAEINMRRAEIGNGRILQMDAAAGLDVAAAQGEKTDLLLLDPPRRGAAEIMKRVLRILPERIIYISCDPATLMRDLRRLTPKPYGLRRLIPLDMFPQTHHIECITLLEKN